MSGRIWVVEVCQDRNWKVRVFDTWQEADEFARDIRRVANQQNRAVQVTTWELTASEKCGK